MAGILRCALFLLAAFARTEADKNVFGQELASCGSDNECVYNSGDVGAHQVCVTELPAEFSSSTGQGDWSREVAGSSWCICIWAYSNYVLQGQSGDLPVNCAAIPENVLMSSYSLDKFQECGLMASSCSQYVTAIEQMCSTCNEQAPDEEGRAVLASLCTEIKGEAEGAPEASAKFMLAGPLSSMQVGVGASLVAAVTLSVAVLSLGLAIRRVGNTDDATLLERNAPSGIELE